MKSKEFYAIDGAVEIGKKAKLLVQINGQMMWIATSPVQHMIQYPDGTADIVTKNTVYKGRN